VAARFGRFDCFGRFDRFELVDRVLAAVLLDLVAAVFVDPGPAFGKLEPPRFERPLVVVPVVAFVALDLVGSCFGARLDLQGRGSKVLKTSNLASMFLG